MPPEKIKTKKIVVIDDNASNLLLAQAILKRSHPDYSVLTTFSGLDGIELVKREMPDTILLDIYMPETDGFETCRYIKSNPQTGHIPVLMISAGARDTETRLLGLNAGADAILSRPFDRAEFIAILNVMLRIKKAEDSLREKNRKLQDYQARLKKLNTELSDMQEKERKNIAEFLHDGIAQNLSLAYIRLTSLQSFELPEKANKVIIDSIELLNQSIRETRSLTYDLCPPILYELGLMAAIKWKLDQIENKFRINTELKTNVEILTLNNKLSIILYRIILELLNNVIKHAKAELITIEILIKQKNLYITVADNGKGFNIQEKSRLTFTGGFGLFNIRERLETIRGTLYIDSTVVSGTKFVIKIPI